jgi:hypothetical protein
MTARWVTAINAMTMIQNTESVNPLCGPCSRKVMDMQDCKLTPEMAAVIKLARAKRIPYSWISGYYFGLNFGRIGDVVKGRRFPEVPAAPALPADFPTA